MRLLAAALVTLAALAGCAGPDLTDDAEMLADEVRALPAVQSVQLEYIKPVTLNSGRVALNVRLDYAASVDQTVAVVETVYEAFRTIHHDEEGDAELTVGDDTVRIRSFEPTPRTAAVADEARAVLAVRDRGALTIEISGQEPAARDAPGSLNTLTLGQGSGVEEILVELTALEDALGDPPERRWTVAADSGDAIGGGPGLPAVETLDLWADLREAAAALGEASIMLDAFGVGADATRFAVVDIAGLDVRADPAPIIAAAAAQIAHLRLDNDLWSYELQADGTPVAFIDPLICSPDVSSVDEPNPVDEALRTEQNCHLAVGESESTDG